jgi:hypothetical protein
MEDGLVVRGRGTASENIGQTIKSGLVVKGPSLTQYMIGF